ncbi:MAG: bifunctional enoyl-CoA hydratase/phosphate acetyltransferase [Rickettsiales bacterium]|nr:bifunctional enoyl-CoA hydratase/phosphate acetyltransferase [Rickettsiales bacterium]
MKYLENKTFKEIKLGDEASISKTLSRQDIELFAIMSGDTNPEHLDAEFAKHTKYHEIIGHGMWTGSLLSAVLGTKLPGPGTIYLKQTLDFLEPVTVGDTVTIKVKVTDKKREDNIVVLDCECINQDGKKVISGEATVIASQKKIKVKKFDLPSLKIERDKKNSLSSKIIESAKSLSPLITGVVQPIDANSLAGAIEAAEDKLIIPILIGEKNKIKKIAQHTKINLNKYKIIEAKNDHDAVLKAIDLVKKGKIEAIMKGKIHTDGLLSPVIAKENGLLTAERKVSHVFVLDVPSYHKFLFLTDAAINIEPSLLFKKSIVQNAIDLFHVLGLGTPKVAIISATETVNEKMPATLDATALCKMSERGQITGGVLDGPLAIDNAISKEAAKSKGIVSHVAGDADILVMPNIEAGNALYKQMRYMFKIEGAGIVLGTKVPIILTSRAALPGLTRKFSCAISLIYARHKQATLK